jgi:hypothetical protein
MGSFLAETTDVLQRTPIVLRALLTHLSERWTNTPDVEGGWRPHDVVGHLISAELDDWMPRTRLILDHGTSRLFEPFDRFAHVERDVGATLDELVDRFAQLRAQGLVELGSLVTDGDLGRRGLHPSLGEVTLRQLLATWAVHDLDHTAQIFAGMAGSHDSAVGPWRAYLGIVLRREDPAAIPG